MDDPPVPEEPPTAADLDRIEQMLESQPPDYVVPVRDISPLIRRLVAEVRRLSAENERLRDRTRHLEN